MKYPDGRDVKLGDRVELGENEGGIVVCSLDASEFTEQYPEEKWAQLGRGVLISFPKYGLIHYLEPDLRLIERKM